MAQLHRRVHRLPHPGLSALGLAALLAGATASAQRPPTAPAPATAQAAAPRAGDDAVGRSVAEVDDLLAGLRAGDPTARRAAAEAAVAAVDPDDVEALRQRALRPLGVDLMALRIAMIRAVRAATNGREGVAYDLLDALTRQPRTREVDVAVERVTLARALGRIPTVDAGRAIVALAVAHEGAFRLEVERVIRAQLRDYVLPAFIEVRAPSPGVRAFIRRSREALRRVTPGQTVQQHDNALLAEVLRAYGRTRQPDALQVVVSFVNNDRAQVREAARWAVSQYGREAINVLRDAYEIYEGREPPRPWGWERVARELYAANDRRRAAEVTQSLEAGLAAGRAGDPDAMLRHFRRVLARHPTFERRAEMVAPLEAHARALEATDGARAESVYRLALWIDPTGPRAPALRSALLFLDAERALGRGVADPELYRAALRADPANARARAQLAEVEQADVLRARRQRRALGALGLFALALGAVWALTRGALLGERAARATASTPPSPGDADGDALATDPSATTPARDDERPAA